MNSYYSIDAILTDAHKVPCTFELAVPGLGYLDDNAGGDVRHPVPFLVSFPTSSPTKITSTPLTFSHTDICRHNSPPSPLPRRAACPPTPWALPISARNPRSPHMPLSQCSKCAESGP